MGTAPTPSCSTDGGTCTARRWMQMQMRICIQMQMQMQIRMQMQMRMCRNIRLL